MANIKGDIIVDGNVTVDATTIQNEFNVQDTKFKIIKTDDTTTFLQFQINGTLTANNTLTTSQTSNITVDLPDTTDTLIGLDTIDTLTNKDITDSSSNVAVGGIFTSSGGNIVRVVDASEPSTGQVLTATSNSTATWQTPSSGSAVRILNATNPVFSTKNSTYQKIKHICWPGTTELGCDTSGNIVASIYCDAGATADFRIQDITNATTIASTTGVSSTSSLNVLEFSATYPTTQAIWESQIRRATGSGNQLVYSEGAGVIYGNF